MRHLSLCRIPLIALALFTLTGCTSTPAVDRSTISMPAVVLPAKVAATGYGALPTQEGLSMEQRRLLAMRASKLDAYRSLAETMAGLKITGNSTVSAVTMNNDSFRVYVEAYLRGARVLTVTPLPGGSYETVLELQLGGEFHRNASVAAQDQPVATPSHAQPAIQVVEKPTPKAEPNAASSNFYLAQ